MPVKNARWQATVTYRTQTGLISIEHFLEEIGDLQELVEAGPHWDTIKSVYIIRINHCDSPNLTVEQAENL